MLPWAVFLWRWTGDPFYSNAFLNIAIEVYTDSAGLAQQSGFMSSVGFTSLGEVVQVQPARFFGLEAELGLIQPRMLADLVLLEANPLDDIANTRRIRRVLAGGRWAFTADDHAAPGGEP